MRIKIGSIVEIPTTKGLAYALYTHKHDQPPKYGAVIRVFEGIHSKRPNDFIFLAAQPVQFTTFFPLGAYVHRKAVQIVGNISIPDHLATFPTFRIAGLSDPITKRPHRWSLWDGINKKRISQLTHEQLKLPTLSVCNDKMLIHQIEKGWHSEDDPR